MPFWTKLYSNHTNFLQFGWKNYISKFWKIISSFQKYSSLLLFTPIILITKLSNVWRDVNMRTSNSPLRHMCVLSTRTYPKRSKRMTSSTRITMWSHLNCDYNGEDIWVEAPRDVRNSNVRKQDKFRRDSSQHKSQSWTGPCVRGSKRPLLAYRTRYKCSIETLHN